MRFEPTFRAATLAAALLLLGGCGDDDDKAGSTSAAPEPATPTVVAVSAEPSGGDKARYEMPSTVKAGLTRITFTNNTKGPREASLVRVDGTRTEKEVLAVLNDSGEGGIPAWIHGAGGVAGIAPGASATSDQVLVPGRYYLTDSTDPDSEVTPAKPLQFEVSGPAAEDQTLPAVSAQVTARDYGFSFRGLKAGRNRVHFRNVGKELHHALFFAEAPGATRAQVLKFFSEQGEGPGKPPIDFSKMSGTTVLDGGVEQNTDLMLEAGKYAVVCFLPDRAGGPPHIAKGMFGEVTIK